MICPLPAALAADVATTNIIGVAPNVRCYRGMIPQVPGIDPAVNLPCVEWQVVGGTTDLMLVDEPVNDFVRVQVNCLALKVSVADQLADVVRAALNKVGNCLGPNPDIFDVDTRWYGVSFDYSFYVARP